MKVSQPKALRARRGSLRFIRFTMAEDGSMIPVAVDRKGKEVFGRRMSISEAHDFLFKRAEVRASAYIQ